jgi:hypothetical protein
VRIARGLYGTNILVQVDLVLVLVGGLDPSLRHHR